MDLELARLYETPGFEKAAEAEKENIEKLAQAELFVKLAAEHNIDLNALTDEQVSELWTETFSKQAEDDKEKKEEHEKKETPAEEKKEEEAKKEAAAEFEAISEQREKLAFADKCGRVMAHAYVQELGLINQAIEKNAGELPPALVAHMKGKKGDEKDEKEDKKDKDEKDEKKKEGAAIDRLAVEHAIKMAGEADFDVKVATARVNAIHTLGLQESTKIASAQSLDEAVKTRALEYLEAAGYPVKWGEG